MEEFGRERQSEREWKSLEERDRVKESGRVWKRERQREKKTNDVGDRRVPFNKQILTPPPPTHTHTLIHVRHT